MTHIDVVVVSFNSRKHLRSCIEPLVKAPDLRVIVVDNGSSDDSLSTVDDLPIMRIALRENHGFARGCNAGWRAGDAPAVLFLNPDARIDVPSVRRLARRLVETRLAGAVGPKLLDNNNVVAFSQRRFPTLRSTFAQAFFVHRALPNRQWTTEVVQDVRKYGEAGSPEWLSGACLLVRRSLLEERDGLDGGFFLYCEDMDLCRRIRQSGFEVLYEPEAIARHEGGASSPRASLLPVLTQSRIRYAAKHRSRRAALVEQFGIALEALTHLVICQGGMQRRRAHARSLRAALHRLPSAHTLEEGS